MPSLDSPFGFFLMVDLMLFPVGVLVLLFILGKARRVERALWAVVSQLQAMRREEHNPAPVVLTPSGREAPAPTRKVLMSMFGR